LSNIFSKAIQRHRWRFWFTNLPHTTSWFSSLAFI